MVTPGLDSRRTVLSWAMYDWANSAFATTVMAGFFPLYFKDYMNVGVDTTVSTARLGVANSLAGIGVALLAPLLGAIADRGSAKRRFLFFFAMLGAVMTAGLFWVRQGHWQMALFTYVLATVGFSGGNIFYDALITGVASPKKMNMVSSWGYALGYLGGALLFAFNVWMVQRPETFGLPDASTAVRLAFLMVSLWWGLFSIPLFLFVKEPIHPQRARGLAVIRAGLRELGQTFSEIRRTRAIFLFLLAYWFYIDGVDTIIRMAVDYGRSIGLDAGGLIKALLLTNFIGFPAALAFGWIGNRIGARRGIFLAIGVYIVITLWATFMRSTWEFYLLATFIGLVQGGVQALSRSYFTTLIPAEKAAQFFGLYNMLGKFAVVLGPLLISLVALGARQLGTSPDTASRLSIGSIVLLFSIGALLLHRVDPGDQGG